MKGFNFIYQVNNKIIEENNGNLKKIIFSAVRDQKIVLNNTPKMISILLRQPIDDELNQFFEDNTKLNWYNESLGYTHIMVLEKQPTQRWIENNISKLRIDRKQLPCLVYILQQNKEWFFLNWKLQIKGKDIRKIMMESLIVSEKIQKIIKRKNPILKAKLFLKYKQIEGKAIGFISRMSGEAAEESMKKYLGTLFNE